MLEVAVQAFGRPQPQRVPGQLIVTASRVLESIQSARNSRHPVAAQAAKSGTEALAR